MGVKEIRRRNFLFSRPGKALAAATLFALSGCAAIDRPYPLADFYRDAYTARAHVRGVPDDWTVTKAERNQLLNQLVYLSDLEYADFESSLYVSNAAANAVADVAIMASSGAATVVGGEGVKAALSAVSAGIAGTRAAIDRAFYAEQSRTALIATMRAARANRLAAIEAGKRQSVARYPLSEGINDVARYQKAGSIIAALEGITKDATASLSVAQERLDDVRSLPPEAE